MWKRRRKPKFRGICDVVSTVVSVVKQMTQLLLQYFMWYVYLSHFTNEQTGLVTKISMATSREGAVFRVLGPSQGLHVGPE